MRSIATLLCLVFSVPVHTAGIVSDVRALRMAGTDDAPAIVDMMERYYAEEGYSFDRAAALACS